MRPEPIARPIITELEFAVPNPNTVTTWCIVTAIEFAAMTDCVSRPKMAICKMLAMPNATPSPTTGSATFRKSLRKWPSGARKLLRRSGSLVLRAAKAKTIAQYLGDGYEVQASVGHIRDLASKKEIPADKKAAYGKYSIDVYRGLDMSLPGILAHRSILNGNKPMDFPDFRDPAQRDLYRNDHACVDPKIAGDAVVPSSSFPMEPLSEEGYAKIRKIWLDAEAKKAIATSGNEK